MNQNNSNGFPPAAGLWSVGPNPAQNGIASIFGRPEVRGLYYNGKTIVLDGYHFIECRFDNCTLDISSSNFNLTRCIIDTSTSIRYSAEAQKLIKLFNSRYPWAYSHFPGFVPTLNPDGSITI